MTLDQPWKIAALLLLLGLLRIAWGLWHRAPARVFMVELLDSALIAFVLVFVLIRPFVVQAFYIPSASMEPTLMGPWKGQSRMMVSVHEGVQETPRRSRQGDRILVNKFIYRLSAPNRGDIIVFAAPPQAVGGNEHKDFVKRLVGLPGDEIHIRSGEGVYINGRRLEEPSTVAVPGYDWPLDELGFPSEEPYRVPEESYFVLGDNRNDSNDSHRWRDPVTGEARPDLAASRVLGKAMAIFWPPPRIGLTQDNHDVRLAPEAVQASAGGTAEAVGLP